MFRCFPFVFTFCLLLLKYYNYTSTFRGREMKGSSLISSKLIVNREGELSIGQNKPELQYCCTHKLLYKTDTGCQFCETKKPKMLNLHHKENKDITLIKCPRCRETSLFWIEQIQAYECLNSRCRISYTQVQYDQSLQHDSQNHVPEDSELQISVVKVAANTRGRQKLTIQALAAQKEITRALENLHSKLDHNEICV